MFIRFLGGVEWLENKTETIRWNANPRIANAQLDHSCPLIDFDLKAQAATPWHGLAGINDKIEKDLLNLCRNHGRLRPSVVLFLNLDAVFAQVFFRQE